MTMWGWVGDALGRRWAMIIPAAIAVPLAPVYLLSHCIVVQGAFGGALYSQLPSYLSERFPTETDDGKCLLLPQTIDLPSSHTHQPGRRLDRQPHVRQIDQHTKSRQLPFAHLDHRHRTPPWAASLPEGKERSECLVIAEG